MRIAALVDGADRLRIESAVIDAERATAGEIVVAVVEVCDRYAGAGWRAGTGLAVLACLTLAVLRPDLPLWACLAAQAAGLAVGHATARIGAVRRHLVAASARDARVAERARRAFAEGGLERTPGRTGILVFAALFERRIVVLADEGIDRQVVGSTWLEVAALAARGLGEDRAADGLVAAVKRCGAILEQYAPGAPRAVAELPDAVRTDP